MKKGLSEGIADYFPGSYTGDATIGECVLFQPRDMNNPEINSYSEYQSSSPVPQHDGGEFFSAILWDLRNSGQIAQQTADEIIFEAISRLPGEPSFIEYRDAMMAADDFAFSGNHNNLIQDTFAAWGVGNPVPPPSPTVSISGPTNLFEGQTGTFTANVSGGQPPYQYQWSSSPASTTSSSSTYYYTPQQQGTKTIYLHVVDSIGGTKDVQRTVTVIGSAGPFY